MREKRGGLRAPAVSRMLLSVLTLVSCLMAGTALAADENLAKDAPASPANKLTGDPALAFQGGYILPKEQVSGTVIGSRESKTLFAGGDVLYVRFMPDVESKVGDRFTIYKSGKPVYHPITRAYMGHLIAILGIVEVISPSANRTSEARVVRSFDSISPGNPIMPFKMPPAASSQGASERPMVTGVIAEFRVPQQVTAQGDIVYIDRGAADGVAIGDRFSVISPGKLGPTATRLPNEKIAELRILGVQEHTATALVTQSRDALGRGNIVMQLPPVAKAMPEAAVTPAKPEIEVVTKTPEPARRELADIYFEFNQWSLSDKAKQDLVESTVILRQNPAAKLLIEGHADERGSREYNLALGDKRAREIERFLTGLGLPNPISVTSLGKDRPVCTEHDEACHAKNRRAHLVINGN